MPLPIGLRALASRAFRINYAGTLVSQVGNWMQSVTQSWLVLQLTGSPFLASADPESCPECGAPLAVLAARGR